MSEGIPERAKNKPGMDKNIKTNERASFKGQILPLFIITLLICVGMFLLTIYLTPGRSVGFKFNMWGASIMLCTFPIVLLMMLLSEIHDENKNSRCQRQKEQGEREQERRQPLVQIASSPFVPPDPYLATEAELQARIEHAQKLQRLHDLRKQVEEEERKAGIFAPTLSPVASASSSDSAALPSAEQSRRTQDSLHELTVSDTAAHDSRRGDPLTDEMNKLARRQVEAERQKHLLQSRRVVEDAEREADGL